MIRRVPNTRSGITLTEILISILIMGVGIVSLATLFPLGLIRLRDAARLSRSGYLTESAAADLGTRNLLNKSSFLNAYFTSSQLDASNNPIPWFATATSGSYDPWIQDTPGYNLDWGPSDQPAGAYRGYGGLGLASGGNTLFHPGSGLPVAYDPLWRYQTGIYPDGTVREARFGSGIGFLRQDPNGDTTSALSSAHGLQRITNFGPLLSTASSVPSVFVSPEDVIMQDNDQSSNGTLSSVVPILTPPTTGSVPTVTNEWKYSWMFTGQQSDASNGAVFDGDIVVFENRPFGIDAVTSPFNSAVSLQRVSGEIVVEAVFGYSSSVLTTGTLGYGAAAKRVVLLRWPASMPDPDIRVGSWIADVTYERFSASDLARAYTDPSAGGAMAFYPYQRCYWYQIVKRTNAEAAVTFNNDNGTAFRSMTVWVGTDLRAFTLLDSSQSPVAPYHTNAALIAPEVVNVFPRTVYTR